MRSKSTAVAAATTIASLSAAVLAADNLLGFVDFHLLGFGMSPVVVALAVLSAAAAVVFAVRATDLARGITAASVIGFVLTLSPAGLMVLSFAISTALQTVVALGFMAAAIVTWRSSRGPTARSVSAAAIGVAGLWAIGTFVPMQLEVFLLTQAATLLAVSILAARPGLRWVAAQIRTMWMSAEIR